MATINVKQKEFELKSGTVYNVEIHGERLINNNYTPSGNEKQFIYNNEELLFIKKDLYMYVFINTRGDEVRYVLGECISISEAIISIEKKIHYNELLTNYKKNTSV